LLGWIWNKREHGMLVFVFRDETSVVLVAAKAGTADQDNS
jgi:aspartyl-tRNA synthetase